MLYAIVGCDIPSGIIGVGKVIFIITFKYDTGIKPVDIFLKLL